jgi:dTDP-4-dehydrorhamnose reductase
MGIECTVNRVGDDYHDQLARNGHAHRISDLELFAGLGVGTMRYPVLWERTAPDGPERANWSWADERLSRLRDLGIRPIVGLMHHGSGPRYTSLIDPDFPDNLAAYARALAQRYPWVDSYTPINEPLTTARFSGLYGLWYPHGFDDATFARALVQQCRATVLAMRAIREVNPGAQLIQTEDLGKTHSTRTLAYQAKFENERRWLSFDLLTGKVGPDHELWNYLEDSGIEAGELRWLAENPCPPDVVGINYYVTSERFLDERLSRYPPHTHGGNDRHTYADIEAVVARAEGLAGSRVLLREAWERYRLPIAVTEAHLGCTREEQLRWLKEVWDNAKVLVREGVDVRAVTAWSLLGAYDWNKLVTCSEGCYESGVFDLRAPQPRPTALARMIRELADGHEPEHPVLETPGWWRRLDRLLYPPVDGRRPGPLASLKVTTRRGASRPLLITGATGTLGKAFARICDVRGLSCRLLSRNQLDIADAGSVEKALQEYEPWALINAAGYVRVDEAEREPGICRRENTDGPALLARSCARRKLPLVTFSSDLVFDGTARTPYVETDATAPLSVYGKSKVAAELKVLSNLPSALVIRTSAFFGPWDEHNFVIGALRACAAGEPFVAADDAVVSPTYVPDLINAALDLLIDGEQGLWHLANPGAITWAEFARRAAEVTGLDTAGIEPRSTSALGLAAPRPVFSALSSERGILLPPLEDALQRYARESEIEWRLTATGRGEKIAKPARAAAAGPK